MSEWSDGDMSRCSADSPDSNSRFNEPRYAPFLVLVVWTDHPEQSLMTSRLPTLLSTRLCAGRVSMPLDSPLTLILS